MPWEIPRVDYAVIGGSSTFSIAFPEELNYPDTKLLKSELIFRTPFGESPDFKLFSVKGKKVLTCKMHGWRTGISRADASRQVFWVFKEAGVKRVIAEGGVGAINHLLKPRDLLTPSDYIDFSMRKDVNLGEPYLLVMRQAVCPTVRQALFEAAKNSTLTKGRVFDRGNYVVTDGRHFESPAEVSMLKQWNGDMVGQSMCPEVYLAREIGACYARIDMVVNYAEGVIKDWEHQELKDIFYEESKNIGHIILDTITKVDIDQECGCPELRKPTLLKEKTD